MRSALHAEWTKLRTALDDGRGAVEIVGSDARWVIRVETVGYARRHDASRRLGFGG